MNQKYSDYLKSPQWQAKRQQILDFWGHRCYICNSPDHLEVYHRTYDRLGHELLTDCIVLCEECRKRNSHVIDPDQFWWVCEAMRLVNAAKDFAGDGFFSDEELEHLAGAAYSTFKAWDELRNNGSNFDE